MKKLLFPLMLLLVVSAGCTCRIPGINQPPTAYIDSVSPPEAATGETVAFKGHGTDPDGTVVAYRWRSSLDGDLSAEASFETSSLSEGRHIIFFKVQDNNGAWSEDVQALAMVSGATVAPPLINSFSASPGNITIGGSSTLSWNVSGATSVWVDQGVGNVSLTGSTSVSPPMNTTYTLTATNAAGSVTATTLVTVSGVPPPPPPAGLPIIDFFTANPPSIPAGDSTNLSWSVFNADLVNISQGVGSVPLAGSTAVSPATTTNYTLTATNAYGWRSVTITVMVAAAGIPDLIVSSLTHSPASPTTTDLITFTAVVRNIGTGTAGASMLSLKVGGETIPPQYNVPALAPGATYAVQRQLTLGVAQNYLITAQADVNNDVPTESNEANNQRTDTVIVAAAGAPDLVVSSLTHSPASPSTTDLITFTAVVRNIGTGTAGASKLSLKVGGETIPPKYNVPALAPGATYAVQRQLTLGVAQNYLITAQADVNNDVPTESNEANNQRTDTVTVH